jgi:hypothetical protein
VDIQYRCVRQGNNENILQYSLEPGVRQV